jgi:hypothetical protein
MEISEMPFPKAAERIDIPEGPVSLASGRRRLANSP